MFHTTPYDPGPLGDNCNYVPVEKILKINSATENASALKRMLAGAALCTAFINGASMLAEQLNNVSSVTEPSKILLEHVAIEGEELLHDELAMFKIATWVKSTYNVPTPFALETVRTIVKTSLSMSTDPYLILAIAAVESNFNPAAQSNRGAQGIIQVRASVHGAVKELTLTEQVQAGINVLMEKKKAYSEADTAELLQRYNGNIKDKHSKYATKVLELKRVFKSIAESEFGIPVHQTSVESAVVNTITTPEVLDLQRI